MAWAGALAPIIAPNLALAEAQAIHREDIVLTGRQVMHRVPIDVGPSDEPASVELRLRTSAQVDEARSVVRLSVDGTPRSSVPLADAVAVTGWRVELGDLEPGLHAVELEASLVPLKRDCTRDELSLWLVLGHGSQIDHAPGGATVLPIRELPARWRGMEPEAVTVLSANEGAGAAKAAVLADHVLRSWGLEVDHHSGQPEKSAAPRVELLTRRSAPASWVELDAKLDEAPGATGVIEATSEVLRILARSDEDLPQVLHTLSSAQFRQLCGAGACLVADTIGQAPHDGPRPSSVALGVVATMATAGFPDGWEASGQGRHVLAFDWSPPPGTVIERWPVLHLPVRWSGGPQGSVLSVRIAGRRVASFDLDGFDANETTDLAIRIPKAWWSRSAWPVEVDVRLGGDEDHCTDRAENLPWLVVEPEARLVVPHASPAPTGIAGWYASRLEEGATVSVAWTPSAAPTQTQQVAALLFPLSAAGGGPGFSFEAAESDVPTVHVRVQPSGGSGVTADERGSAVHWFDESGVLGMPLLDADRVAYLGVVGRDLEFVPASVADEVPVPPLGGMIGRKALLTHDGRWEPFDVPEQLEPGARASSEASSSFDASRRPPPASREARSHRILDLVWLLCSVIIVGLVVLTLRRRAAA